MMLCQYCNRREAEYRFLYNYNGQASDVRLCKECADRLHAQYLEFMKHMKHYLGGVEAGGPPAPVGWETIFPESVRKAMADTDRIPADAGEEIRRRRRLGELRAHLEKAVSAEDYENAARLLDEITRTEQKVTQGGRKHDS